jgi:hypothetical protein
MRTVEWHGLHVTRAAGAYTTLVKLQLQRQNDEDEEEAEVAVVRNQGHAMRPEDVKRLSLEVEQRRHSKSLSAAPSLPTERGVGAALTAVVVSRDLEGEGGALAVPEGHAKRERLWWRKKVQSEGKTSDETQPEVRSLCDVCACLAPKTMAVTSVSSEGQG